MSRKQSSNLLHNLALGIRVSPEDLDLLETHCFSVARGYAQTKINGKTIHLHRLVHSRMTGRPLEEYTAKDHVRHIDPNGLNCCRSNLFEKTGATANNCDLNVRLHSSNTSGIHGVCWDKQHNKWRVRLRYLNRLINLGRYDTLEQAARVADRCRVIRSEITCADTTMDYETMRDLLQSAAATINQGGTE